jgi:hypothetical protein
LFAMSLSLAGCAPQPAATPAEQAEASACTAQADAGYQANNYDALSRTSQNGLYFAPTPNHAFDSQRMGSLHVRDSQITACEQNGSDAGAIAPGTQIVTPHIVGQ